ncbi:MAG: cytochrome c, partial [Chloroflexi bacterium]|nr:cytochrome c [Chloroflexota bacterium]
GLNGQGTRWAPMRVTAPEQVHMMVRIGPGGMPAYSKDYLPDSTVDLMAGWLVEAAASKPAPPPTALSTPPATSTPPPPQPPATSTVAAPVSTPPATGTTVPPQTTTPAPAAPATPAGNIETGERIYSDLGCSGCHAKGGKGTAFAPALVGPVFADKYRTDPALAELMRKGKGMMPAYGSFKLSDQGLADLIAYLRSLDR